MESYDVIVIGSEIQGMLLAKEARTLGLNVLVLDPRSRPGGELIQSQMFFLDDVNDNRKNSLVQGEIKHLFDGYKAGTIAASSDIGGLPADSRPRQIRLRSFELKSYDNVLVIGKNIGTTNKAYGSARIMPTNALAAQTIGIILGRERNKPLNELTESDFYRIHSYLKKDYHIVLK
ncbi:FAD-dependent oxidoreductase [Paenibacillus zanthoxyli]|uniref:FAD-dependent oxidoreductase n=1 Tax=Paenibacillus zanthoxyli TaxID=369399 RepID=UPI0018DDF067|nr:FAD-dependent oxidoreductase [Paenibacillus zanthoxyli]